MVRCESRPSTIGHITLDTKQTGAPSAGNPHAGCDVAGAGDGFTVWLLRHSQRKRGETDRPDLRNTAPVLDPTGSIAANHGDQFTSDNQTLSRDQMCDVRESHTFARDVITTPDFQIPGRNWGRPF